MIESLTDLLDGRLPLLVKELDFEDPILSLIGTEWALSVACPWSLRRDGESVSSMDDTDARWELGRLVGERITGVTDGSGARSGPVFSFADGTELEILPDTDIDPWTMRYGGTTFVG